MKKIAKLTAIALCMGIVGCQQKLDTIDDGSAGIGSNTNSGAAVYMNDKLQTINIAKANEGGEADVEVRLASIPNNDVKVNIAAQDFFGDYNKENGTRFRMLPSSMYELYEVANPTNTSSNGSITITVKKGEVSAKVGIRVKPLDDDDYPVAIKYAIPLSIDGSTGTKVLSNNKSVINFNRPFKTSVLELKQANNFRVDFAPEIETTEEFTIQGHFMFLNWDVITHDWNQSLINFGGGPGANWWYTRVDKGSFQVKDLDADGDATRIFQTVELKTWYQISFVYKENNLKVYINGKLAKTFVRPNLSIQQGKAGMAIGNTGKANSRDFIIREVRVWNRALTETEVNDDLYLPVDPTSEGLLVYLPLDKKNGFKELTKYNNKVTLRRDYNGKEQNVEEKDLQYSWKENVKFPAKGLEIEND